ncbi:LIM domain-containing protein ajuba isoform X2 [Anguilla rostrata]|uniref:LIM domain-containing protein ajuba isoform X2 n=1 Tax=Anguilla rostrata TaxID=7938 RepID=UPI0030CF00D0
MDRLSSKLLEKLKLTDSGSVKFSSKKKGEPANANNNNSCSSGGGAGTGHTARPPPGPSEVSGCVCRAPPVSPAPLPSDTGPSAEPHPAVAEPPLRRGYPARQADGGSPAAPLGVGLVASHRRYSLELQHLAHRRQLLSQPAPPLCVPPGGGPLRCGGEPGFPPELERHKRFSLQEALVYKRHSTGGEPWDRPAPLSLPPARPPAGPALSPRSSLSLQEALLASPRSSLSLQEALLASPRSSFASSASGGSPMGSRCSSNRTSGISLGFDSRHAQLPAPPPAAGAGHAQAGGGRAGVGAGAPSAEMWREYLDGAGGAGQDSRHSYPPALGSPAAASLLGPSWGGRLLQGGPGDRARYSDLPGPRYQEELTQLLRWEAALRGEDPGDPTGLLGTLEGLALKDPPTRPLPSPAPPQPKPPAEQGAARDSDSRQEYFGTCVKCGKGVYGTESACQALDSLYHTHCFTCVSCGRTLRNKDFYNFSGFQAAAEKCSVCGHLILEKILQALGNSYHPGCFRCVVCAKTLDGVPFTVDYLNNVYCVSDYNRTFAPKCAACLQPILPTEGSEEILRVVSMNKDYHFECYHCEGCGKQLSDQPGSQCFPLDSHLLCHSCHMTRVCTTLNLLPPNSQ